MAGAVRLEIPPHAEHLALVRLVVECTARLEGLPESKVDDLRLAVSEACANALEAHAEAGSDEPIAITIEAEPDVVTVTVTDRAGGFDVERVDPIPPATDPNRLRHERGLGIPIMRSLVDDVTFTRTDDGTAVRLAIRV